MTKHDPLRRMRVFAMTASPQRLARAFTIYMSVVMVVFFGVIMLASDARHSGLAILIGLAVMVGTLALLHLIFTKRYYSYAIRYGRGKLDEAVGFKLSGADRVALDDWARHGIWPRDARVQAILPAYLHYLERLADGRASLQSPKVGWLVAVAVGFNILTQLPRAVQTWPHWDGLQLVSYGFLLLGVLLAACSLPGRQVKPVIRLLNRPMRKRLTRMRRQLREHGQTPLDNN